MAPVNPVIQPTNAPRYGQDSRPVGVPNDIRPQGIQQNQIMPRGQEIGDRSAAFEGQAEAYRSAGEAQNYMGDLFRDIVGGVDFALKTGVSLVKKDIENKVYQVADETRRDYTTALETIKAGGIGPKNILNPGSDATEGGSTPSEIEGLSDHLSNLTGARDAGKISNTYYMGRLLAEAKDLRAKYPGFREEIDQQFAKVTGVNPANAYITALVQDINRQGQGQAAERKATLAYIRSHQKYPGFDQLYGQYERGEVTSQEVMSRAAPYEQQEYKLNQQILAINAKRANREDTTEDGKVLADSTIATIVQNSTDSLMTKLGLTSPEAAADLDSKFKAGAISSQRFSEIGQVYANEQAALRVQLIREADKSGLTKLIGKDEVLKRIDAGMAPMKVIEDRIFNKDFGGIYSAGQNIKSMNDDNVKAISNDPKIGPYFQQVQALKQIGGEQNLRDMTLKMLHDNIDTKYQDFYKRRTLEFTTQYNMKTTGVPYTLNDTIEEFKNKKINNPKMANGLIDTITKGITDSNSTEAMKVNYAMSAFSPENRGFISKLNADGVDSQGRPVKGQNAIFQKMTTPEITKEMKRLGETHPQIWMNYQNWVKETFGNELLNREINDLKRIGEDPNLKIGYDADNHRFSINYVPTPEAKAARPNASGLSAVSQDTAYLPYVQARNSINRINSGLYNLKNLADADNTDVDAYLLRTIKEAGGDLSGVKNIPNEMLRQIDLTRNFNSRFNAR